MLAVITSAAFVGAMGKDVLRGKFRASLSDPEPFVPDEVTKVAFEPKDAFHRFKKGHRIMVQVQSTWFPLIDLNPQNFGDIYHAEAGDFQNVTQRVYHTTRYDSHLGVGVGGAMRAALPTGSLILSKDSLSFLQGRIALAFICAPSGTIRR